MYLVEVLLKNYKCTEIVPKATERRFQLFFSKKHFPSNLYQRMMRVRVCTVEPIPTRCESTLRQGMLKDIYQDSKFEIKCQSGKI